MTVTCDSLINAPSVVSVRTISHFHSIPLEWILARRVCTRSSCHCAIHPSCMLSQAHRSRSMLEFGISHQRSTRENCGNPNYSPDSCGFSPNTNKSKLFFQYFLQKTFFLPLGKIREIYSARSLLKNFSSNSAKFQLKNTITKSNRFCNFLNN